MTRTWLNWAEQKRAYAVACCVVRGDPITSKSRRVVNSKVREIGKGVAGVAGVAGRPIVPPF